MEYNEFTPNTPEKKSTNRTMWMIGLGCGGAIAACLCLVLFAGGIFAVVFGAIRGSDVYGLAVEAAKESAAVVDAVGEPIEEGWFVSGSVNVDGRSGDANLSIPISGPDGRGQIIAEAYRRSGRWEFTTLTVEIENGPIIDLLADQ
jgi:hypothetical protein